MSTTTKTGVGPDLTLKIHTLDNVAADTILMGAEIAYWGRTVLTREVGGLVIGMVVAPHEEQYKYEVSSLGLLSAINEILDGEHVGSLLREQVVRDVLEWEQSPEYGPPFDATVCDAIVQVAALGELVYG